MQITTFKTETHKGCPVYYRNIGHLFEYLTVINGQIYTANVELKPTAINRILHRLGIEKLPYSRQQIQKMLVYMKRIAETTIETLTKT